MMSSWSVQLSLEDWFPILPRSGLHLYSMPVALWPLVLLWCGRQKHNPRWGREGKRKRWNSRQCGAGGGGAFWWCRFHGGMKERKKGWHELAGSRTARWSHHLTDLWRLAPRAGPRWVGRKAARAGGKGSGDGGGLGEGTVVAWADRDVSAASVISRRPAAARGHQGPLRAQAW